MKTLTMLEKNIAFWFIVITSLLFFLLRFPSLFEPYWYGDEGVYQAIGISLNNNQLLYRDIFDNKPPLLYWVYSIFRSDQFSVKLLSAIFGILSIIVFFLLSKKLSQNRLGNYNIVPYLTTSVFALLFGLPLLEGNIANAENFMLLPIISAAFLITYTIKKPLSVNKKSYLLFTAGLLVGLAFLFKIVAIFDFVAFFIFWAIVQLNSFKNIKANLREFKFLITGFLMPTILTSMFFLTQGAFLDFLSATLFTNIPYVAYGNKIGNLPTLLFIKGALLLGFIAYIYKKRHILNKTALFILIWLGFSFFNALFSQRPYTHYALVLLPSISLALGLISLDKKYQKIITVFFLLVLIIVFKNFGFYGFQKTIFYYKNFLAYMYGGKETVSYSAFFDKKTPTDYEIARFIKPKLGRNDSIFVWGNNAQLYKLTNTIPVTKYIVAYHISNYKDGIPATKTTLEKTKPKFIVIMPNQRPIPFSLTDYFHRIQINNASIYERIL